MNIEAIARRMRRVSDYVPSFEPIDTPPPQTLWRFLAWCVSGAYPLLAVAAVVSVIAGAFEIGAAILLGQVIDRALEAGPEAVFVAYWPFLVAVVFYLLILRPAVFGGSSLLQSVGMGPGLNVQVLARLHRWTMGQAVTYFDNDFAGRIAQKAMQTARAVSDIVVEAINTVVFATASFLAATLLLISIDWRLSLILGVWLVGYVMFIRFFLPRIRKRASRRAAARAAVTGQVVDTITNMRTVKLFAHDDHEDRAAIDAMSSYRERALDFGLMATTFRFSLIAIASVIPV
ncbi:MAG: ABC transporter transmembrane domain-containing protein, partial [Planctomycetota bacterium]